MLFYIWLFNLCTWTHTNYIYIYSISNVSKKHRNDTKIILMFFYKESTYFLFWQAPKYCNRKGLKILLWLMRGLGVKKVTNLLSRALINKIKYAFIKMEINTSYDLSYSFSMWKKNPDKQFVYMVSYFSRTDMRVPPFAEPFLFLLVAATSIAT